MFGQTGTGLLRNDKMFAAVQSRTKKENEYRPRVSYSSSPPRICAQETKGKKSSTRRRVGSTRTKERTRMLPSSHTTSKRIVSIFAWPDFRNGRGMG